MKREKQKTKNKKPRTIKSRNGHKMVIKIHEISPKMWRRLVGRICEKGKFWVWSGTEMDWCI